MMVSERRSLSTIWGEDMPPWVWGGLLLAGTLFMILAVRFWLMTDYAVRSNSTAVPPPVEPVKSAVVSSPALASVVDSSLKVSESVTAKTPIDTCPKFFSVTFAVGSDVPYLDSADLDQFVAWMLAHPQAMLVVDGHADAAGLPANNFALSQRRAKAVAARFEAAHLPESRITQRAFGDYVPLEGSSKKSSRNRRVVLSVSGTTLCSNGDVP